VRIDSFDTNGSEQYSISRERSKQPLLNEGFCVLSAGAVLQIGT
jgi:hypothetical protein